MCQGTATLVWGCTIKLTDLCLLAAALPNCEPALLAVDLILARRRQGRLETSGGTGKVDVRALPVELWMAIKTALVKEALVDEGLRVWATFGAGIGCGCWHDWKEGDFPPCRTPPVGTFMYEDILYSCRVGGEVFHDLGGIPGLARSSEAAVLKMLKLFGLCLADASPLSKDDKVFFDANASWAVTPRPASSRAHAAFNLSHDEGSAHSLSHLSSSAFDLPPDAPARFARLFSTYPWLEPTRLPSPGDPRPPSPYSLRPEWAHLSVLEQSAAWNREKRQRLAEEMRLGREPGWMLLCRGSSCS